MRNFFISHAGPDSGWGKWVAWVLEENNYTTQLQDWNSDAGFTAVHAQLPSKHCTR